MASAIRRSVQAAAVVVLSGCTAGQVAIRDMFNGQPTLHGLIGTVTFTDCAGTHFTTKASNGAGGGTVGTFSINPFSPTTTAIDTTKWVSTGPVLMKFSWDSGPGFSSTYDHEYDQKCLVTYDNQSQSEPCSLDVFVFDAPIQYPPPPPLPATINGATVRKMQLFSNSNDAAFAAACAALK